MHVVYEVVSTLIVDHTGHPNHNKSYRSAAAAKGAMTRASKVSSVELAVLSYSEFKAIERSVLRQNMMTRRWYFESVNIPSYMSPACESYFSM